MHLKMNKLFFEWKHLFSDVAFHVYKYVMCRSINAILLQLVIITKCKLKNVFVYLFTILVRHNWLLSWWCSIYYILPVQLFFDISANKGWFTSFKIADIILPELEEMRTAHVVSIGSESFCDLNPHYKAGYLSVWQITDSQCSSHE